MEEEMKTPTKIAILLSASLGLAAMPASASANQSTSISIGIADLNLSGAKGQKELDRRIERAARNVCQASTSRTGTRMPAPGTSECIVAARASARQQVAAMIAAQDKAG
jgi:UrcA family protein